MTTRRERLEQIFALPVEVPDADEVNATFNAPFAGLKEMYALQKGIEHGQGVENARLAPFREMLLEAVEIMEEIEIDPIIGTFLRKVDEVLSE